MTSQLFLHCKQGNLNELKYVVEKKELDVNVRDSWDSTPLYYACLCGHREIVEYLLQNGSKCEATTFDGERCLYGALTDDIRNLLKQWKQVHSTGIRRDRHYELLRNMLTEDTIHKDIAFSVQGLKLTAHRCLLAARSPYFAEALMTRWKNRELIKTNHEKVSADTFNAVLQYLYMGRVDVQLDLVEELKLLANQCELSHLLTEIDLAKDRVSNLVRLKPSMERKVKIISVESDACFTRLKNDLRHLAELCLPAVLRDWVDTGVLPFADSSNRTSYYPDLCVEVEGQQFICHKKAISEIHGRMMNFRIAEASLDLAHVNSVMCCTVLKKYVQVFLCGRSDYFKALLANHFHENKIDEDSATPIITLQQMPAELFKHILIYIYAGVIEFKSLETALDVLPVADMMLLPGLKRLCGNVLSHHFDDNNVIGLYRCSQTFDLPSLENRCTSYMAAELDKMIESEEFMDLAMEEAHLVHDREETDSIPIIDDIRYHVSNVSTYSQMEEASLKLAKLDAMLARLGIEC